MRTPSGAKTKRVFAELGLKDWAKLLGYGLLDNAVDYRSSFVGFDLLPGHCHVFTRQHALEQVERFWFPLQFRGLLRSPIHSSAAWHHHWGGERNSWSLPVRFGPSLG